MTLLLILVKHFFVLISRGFMKFIYSIIGPAISIIVIILICVGIVSDTIQQNECKQYSIDNNVITKWEFMSKCYVVIGDDQVELGAYKRMIRL